MFWKKKQDPIEPEQKEDYKKSNDVSVCMATTLKRRLKHTKSIVGGKLYDTEKATKISGTPDGRLLFVTEKGNYFSCITEHDEYISSEKDGIFQVYEIVYADIRPETLEYAMQSIGKYQPEKYIELFGEVEEA